MRRTTRFRRLIEAPELLLLPGVHDALGARIAEKLGFEAITSGGYSATATLLGRPDTSQLTATEMADYYARLCDSTDLPVFADADTGYGNVTNTGRTVKAYERAGVAGLFIEDQVFPKRCGHMAGKDVVPLEEFLAKLKAALDARTDPDLVIMARTDALAVHGIDEAIERAQAAREAGADLLFVEAPENQDQMRRICAEIDGPCLANNLDGGLSPVLKADLLQEIGYATVAFPTAATYVVAHALEAVLGEIRTTSVATALYDRMYSFETFNELVGLGDLRRKEAGYQDSARDLLARRKNAGKAGGKNRAAE
ncbi:isocitrate lyase/PEP mutase family protein [Oceanibaculum nanhaiense]|uniref:isocitrate lyase/PEP mutase family protein n=1 Tax=Oceanibaculum nanhaiense TaxID=1909734 RepID=UPI003F72381D